MTCCDIERPVTPKRRRSPKNTTDTCENELNLSEEPVLIPLLEDLAIWLSGFLSAEISPDNFIELFEDGVLLCKLASILHQKALEYKERTKHSYPLPSYAIRKWYENPKVGSFFCRDNVCKFINWCKQFGVPEICLFESNDIVEHRTVRALRNVLICLLDVGKIGVKHGIEPSELVRIDLEIEQEIQAELLRAKKVAEQRQPRVPPSSRVPASCRIPASSLNSSLASSSEPPSSEEEAEEEEESEEERPVSSPEPDQEELERIRIKLLSLQEQVRAIVSRCSCKTPFQLDRVGDGKYKLPHTSQIFFVRILRNHVMVRVGGGWDTLDHFIAKHDPCRTKFRQIAGPPSSSRTSTWSSSDTSRPPRRNRSVSMVTSSPVSSEAQPTSWVLDEVSPVAKLPRKLVSARSPFNRASSARYTRKLSYSSESEELSGVSSTKCQDSSDIISYVTPTCLDNTTSPVREADKTTSKFSPLISFRRKDKQVRDDLQQPLTRFSQTKEASRINDSSKINNTFDIIDDSKADESCRNVSQSKIPVPLTRSKSCERKKNTVANVSAIKHSKSGEIRRTNTVLQPQRKTSIPAPVTFKPRLSEVEQLQACLNKTPQSLLSNPTSATARKVLKSKSSEGLQRHLVRGSTSTGSTRSKPGHVETHSKVYVQRTPKSKGLVRSRSSDATKTNNVNLKKSGEAVMKPDLENLNASKSNGRGSFVDWLKKRRNEN